jgi:sigma-B regulation protein RsbU (phosphoserine phosphatase)
MPAPKSQLRTHALAYLGLLVLFLVAVTHFARNGFDSFDVARHASEYVRNPFELGLVNWGAMSLQPEAKAAGMVNGDAVLAVNGRPVDGFVVYYNALRRARVGDRLQVRVQSPPPANADVKDLSIELRPLGETDPLLRTAGRSAYFYIALAQVAMPVMCIALGFWVAAVRISDRSAWLLLVVLLSFATFINTGGGYQALFGRPDILQPLMTGFHVFFGNIAAPALMLFGIAFPERLAIDRRFPWLKWALVGPLMFLVTTESTIFGLEVHRVALAREVQRALDLLPDWIDVLHIVAVVLCFVSLGYKTVTAASRDARRRLLLLDVSAVASVTALILLLVLIRNAVSAPWASPVLLLMVLAFPVTMAYAIVVHRAMDVRVVVRQGLQYVLATNGIRVLQAVISVAIVIMAATMSATTSVPSRIIFMSIGFALLAGLQGFAGRLRGWIDRRFFREAYKTDAILTDLAERVRTMVEVGPLLETVASRIAESLHVPRIAILLNEGGSFRPAYALGYAAPPSVSISEKSLTLKRLRKQHALVEFDNADSWVQLTDGDERASLEELKPELLLPLSLHDKMLGIMSLGPKQSEEPFSKTDIRLLDSVAAQTGLALENGRLTETIKVEAAAREKQRREIEIAHEVQERLFPQDYPPVAGLDYAGACRPALGVGGDYYDFIHLSKTALGIAIGDVSGKGIPAALLMATFRAYLRGLTSNRQTDLTEVMAKLNNLVYESSAANRYATFFYGEFDTASRAFNYVNAGHNPPMVFRPSGGSREVLRLDTGGPVIGLMEDCLYREGRVVLEPGDVLVAYTDGISEAMNAADHEWGDERLMAAVPSNRVVTARALIERLMTSADAFVAGAPQHDDMTLIVVRMT